MNILITGGCGFVGSNLVDKLIELGHHIVIIDNLATGSKSNLNSKAELVKANVEDCFWKRVTNLQKIDVIYHLAALARIQPSFDCPQKTCEVNSSGTINILEIAKEHEAKFIYAGSSSVYHDVYANPYSYSKWLGEEHCKLYNKVYGVSTAIARFFNVYGPRQIEKGAYATVIGIFEKQKREGKPLTITGDGYQSRDFTHVSDIVNGLVALADEKWYATVFNFGRGKSYSINEVAALFGGPTEYIPKRPGEAEMTLADIAFSKKMLNWEPKIDLPEYISSIVS